MARIYLRMIQSGKMALDEVPLLWREEVARLLDAAPQA